MLVSQFLDILRLHSNTGITAIVHGQQEYTYKYLVDAIDKSSQSLEKQGYSGRILIIDSDFNIEAIVILIASLKQNNVVVLTNSNNQKIDYIQRIVQADAIYRSGEDVITPLYHERSSVNKYLIKDLLDSKEGGLVFLSSGSTGKPKAILHSATRFLEKYERSKKALRTLAFLLFDHIAGVDTLFYTLAAGGTLVIPRNRSPKQITEEMEEHKVEVLPTSPSFLNLLMSIEDFKPEQLIDLKIITFGSERMPDSLYKRIRSRIPERIRIIQKFGITEIGSPSVKSRPGDPLWFRFVDDSLGVKIVNNILYIKTQNSMLGYLYEDHDEYFDGWFNTHDTVLTDGQWIKVLGRDTDIINVGGQKVYPTEVESLLLDLDGIVDARVFGVENAILGYVVGAEVVIDRGMGILELRKRIREFFSNHADSYKAPVYITIVDKIMVSSRYKKIRQQIINNKD